MASAERIFKLLDTAATVLAPAAPRPAPADDRAHRVRPRLVRLQRRGLGAARRQLHHRARRNHRRRGPYRRRQDHADQPAAALLRRAAGRIRLGGIDVREFDPLELRRQFGVVLQDPYLFTGTLEENIRLGTEGIRDEDVEAAAEQVNLMDFIRTPAGRLRATPSANAAAGFPPGRSS